MNRTVMWGSLELIHVILDFGDGTANIVTWHFGCQKSIKRSLVVLLYNGSTHFTGTGNIFILGAHVTLFTLHSNVFIKLYRTLSSSVEHFTHRNTILFKHYQTLLNYLKHIF